MKINIYKGISIWNIKTQFTAAFPFLKLEFFRSETNSKHFTSEKEFVNNNTLLIDIQPVICTGILEINEDMKVSELEDIFIKRFMVKVQVLRRSHNTWLETTATDVWTLEQQNEHSKSISEKQSQPPTEAISDYDLERDSD